MIDSARRHRRASARLQLWLVGLVCGLVMLPAAQARPPSTDISQPSYAADELEPSKRLAQRKRRRRRRKGRRKAAKPPARKPAAAPSQGPAGGASNATADAAPQASALRRGARVEFDGRLVQGQTAKSGAIYLFGRKRSELRSMVLHRESYRVEILRTVYPRDEYEAHAE